MITVLSNMSNFNNRLNTKSSNNSKSSTKLPPLSLLLNDSSSLNANDNKENINPLYPNVNLKLPSISSLPINDNIVKPIHSLLKNSPNLSAISNAPAESVSSHHNNKRKTPMKDSKSYAFISHSPSTFPTHEPSIDNHQLARRKRRRTSPNELSILQKEFLKGNTPNKTRRQEIASMINMSEKAIQIWFQNKRQSLRKSSSVEKEITELNPKSYIDYQHQYELTPTKQPLNMTSAVTASSLTNASGNFYSLNSPNKNYVYSPFVMAPPYTNFPLPTPPTAHSHQHHNQHSHQHQHQHQHPINPSPFASNSDIHVTPCKIQFKQIMTPNTPHQIIRKPNSLSSISSTSSNYSIRRSSSINQHQLLSLPSAQNAISSPIALKSVTPVILSEAPASKSAETAISLPVTATPVETGTTKKEGNKIVDLLNSPVSPNVTKDKGLKSPSSSNLNTPCEKRVVKKKEEGVQKGKTEFECVENLLSLRTGMWK